MALILSDLSPSVGILIKKIKNFLTDLHKIKKIKLTLQAFLLIDVELRN